MKAIIVHSVSKKKASMKIAKRFKGDLYEIVPKKKIKWYPLQLLVYGFYTVAKRKVAYTVPKIPLDDYEEIVLVSPVWAGSVNAYMRSFLLDHQVKEKKIHIVGSSDGGYKNYFASFEGLIDPSNEIVEKSMYVKGEKQ